MYLYRVTYAWYGAYNLKALCTLSVFVVQFVHKAQTHNNITVGTHFWFDAKRDSVLWEQCAMHLSPSKRLQISPRQTTAKRENKRTCTMQDTMHYRSSKSTSAASTLNPLSFKITNRVSHVLDIRGSLVVVSHRWNTFSHAGVHWKKTSCWIVSTTAASKPIA